MPSDVALLRGFDPAWADADLSCTSVLVEAPPAEVCRYFTAVCDWPAPSSDLLASVVPMPAEGDDYVIIYRLRGHGWTKLESRSSVTHDDAPAISRFLGVHSWFSSCDNTVGGSAAIAYQQGVPQQGVQSMPPDIFELCCQPLLDEGWTWSEEQQALYLNRASTDAADGDVNRLAEWPEAIAQRLGLYQACFLWNADRDGNVVCDRYPPEDFEQALLIHRPLRRYGEDTKLVIE